MFEHPLQKYTNAVAISNDCTKTSTIDYTYDQEQKLIEEKKQLFSLMIIKHLLVIKNILMIYMEILLKLKVML